MELIQMEICLDITLTKVKNNMHKFCILLMIASLLSCKKDNRVISEIKELTGKTITFVKGYESLCINDSLSISSIISEDIKIISFIEDFTCTACTMNMLSKI